MDIVHQTPPQEEDVFAPILEIFQDESFVRRRTARRNRYYELRAFRIRHPILWRLGARPARAKRVC